MRLIRCFALFAIALFGFAMPINGWAEDEIVAESASDQAKVRTEGRTLSFTTGTKESTIELPVEPGEVIAWGDKVYVALGEAGVHIYQPNASGELVLESRVPVFHGRVTGFLISKGELWARINSTTAVRIESAGGSIVAQDAQVPTDEVSRGMPLDRGATVKSESKEEFFSINRLGNGEVVLGMGAATAVNVGDSFAVFRESKGKGEHGFQGQKLVAVLDVQVVNDKEILADVNRGDRVLEGDIVKRARPTQRSSRVFPRRLYNMVELFAEVRPLLKIGTPSGFGALSDITASYWGKAYFVELALQPLGLGWTGEGKVVSSSLSANAGYDGRAFAVGIGAGLATVNGDLDSMVMSDDDAEYGTSGDPESRSWSQRTRNAFALSQVVRLGARDGLNLTVRNILILHTDSDSQETGFIYGGTNGILSIPLNNKMDLRLNGGGGVMGYGFGTIGVLYWIRGNGDAGSLGVSLSAGGAGVWGKKIETVSNSATGNSYTETADVRVAGPMIAFGLKIRLGQRLSTGK